MRKKNGKVENIYFAGVTLSGQSKPFVRSRFSPCEQRLIVKGDERSGASQEPLTLSVSRVGFQRTDGVTEKKR